MGTVSLVTKNFSSKSFLLGDAYTGTKNVQLTTTGASLSRNITVTVNGTGTITIGSTGGTGNTNFTGQITLNRATTFTGGSTDRTTYTGKITGNAGTLTISGGQRTVFESTSGLNDFTGDLSIEGSGTVLQIGAATLDGENIPNTASVTLASGTILKLASNANKTETINALYGAGSLVLVKNGTGTQSVTTTGQNASGGITVNDGTFKLNAPLAEFNSAVFSASTAFTVNSPGILEVAAAWNIASTNTFTLHGGALHFTHTGSEANANYFNNVTSVNGTISGNAFRTGNNTAVTFQFSGDSGNTISAGMGMVKNGASQSVTMNLANGAASHDLVIGAAITDMINFSGSTLVKTGAGTMVLSGTSTYTGNTFVSAGTLLVTGVLGNIALTVENDATLGGNGTLGGSLSIGVGANLNLIGATIGLSSTNILSVAAGKAITLTDFLFSDIIGWDASAAELGTYTLINGGGTLTLAGTTPTIANPFDFGNGKQGYFQSGSLQVVVIPEPIRLPFRWHWLTAVLAASQTNVMILARKHSIRAGSIFVSLLGFLLAPRVAADVVIAEFMASNVTTLQDGNGKYEDWLELWNQGSSAVNLSGWKLTDSATNLTKFTFPSHTLAAGQRLVVFCSNRAGSTGATAYIDPSGRFHTNFALSASGEYIALVRPDGSKSTEFTPTFPAQSADLSYGINQPSGDLVSATSQARYTIPTSTALDLASPQWTATAFNASAWSLSASSGLGFEAGTPIAYWPMDDNIASSTALDATGNGFNGTRSGSAIFGSAGQSLQTESAVEFPNTLGKITIPYTAALNPNTFTFAAWVYPQASTGNYQSIITSRRAVSPSYGYILYIEPAGNWSFWTRGSSGAWSTLNGPNVNFGQWTHVAISRNAAGVNTLFVNGNSVGTVNGVYQPNVSTPLFLGAGNADGSLYRFAGKIDDAAFWNTALDSSLIQQHRDATGGSFPTPAYGSHYQTNVQSALQHTNPGLYTRYTFTASDPANLNSLLLRMKYDDGFVAYLNGTEIARSNITGSRTYNSVADSDRSDSDAVVWHDFDISTQGLPLLVAGQNTLAIHAMRRSLAHTDFLLNPALVASFSANSAQGFFVSATPGAANAALTSPGPDIETVTHTPAEPLPGDSVIVSARVTPRLAPIQWVTVIPRVQYNAESAAITMTDAGPWPGATDGSRLFTATLPTSSGATARQMLRYYVSSSDTSGRTWRAPFITDISNDDGKSQSPQYYGTVIKDTALGTPAMPVMQWFTQDVGNSDTRTGSRASCFYQGIFYDNIYVRQRGGYTSYGSQKFNFNRGNGLFFNDVIGTVGEVNMNSNGADPSYLRPLLAFDLWRQHGHPACAAHLVALYRNGAFHRMSSMIEQVDEDFLQRHDFDEEGALYKLVQRIGETPLAGGNYSNSPALGDTLYGVEKKTRITEDFSDINALVAGINQSNGSTRDAFLFRNLNIPNFVNFMAIRNLTGDGDTNRKNFYLHRDSNHSGEWRLFPWDKDYSFGVGYGGNVPNPWNSSQTFYADPGSTNQWCVLFEAGYQNLWLRQMVARRVRQLADATFGPPGTAANSTLLESRLELIRTSFSPLPNGVTMNSSYNNRAEIDSWLPTHRNNTYNVYGPTGSLPLIAAVASANPQIDLLSAYALPTTGSNQDHEYIRLSNPTNVAVDISGWALWNPGKTSPLYAFPPGTVIPANSLAPLHQPFVVRNLAAFRARPNAGSIEYVLGEYSGQISARGETIELRDGTLATSRLVSTLQTNATPTAAQQQLRITELMFAPSAPTANELAAAPGASAGDYEFIELRNIGLTPLDLSNIRFTEGIDFTFPVLTLAAGQSTLLVKNTTAFLARYGPGKSIAGSFVGALDNSGERIRLEDAVGEMILDFRYESSWFPPALTSGYSLVTRQDPPSYESYDQAPHWALSNQNGGSPDAAENGNFSHHYTGWLHDHFSLGEQSNLLTSGPEADPDGDGQNNLSEYAFGSNPRLPDARSVLTPTVSSSGGNHSLSLTFKKRHHALDLIYTVETTTDISGTWTTEPWPQIFGTNTEDGCEIVTWTQPSPTSTTKRFARVRVTPQ